MDELTRIPRFASFFRIFALVVSSFLRICWSLKALASTDSFFGLPKRGKFAAEPVRRSFLIKRVMPERLTCNPSQGFKYSSWMEALVIQELDSSSSIVWYFWQNNYQRSMNEWEHFLRSIGILCVAMVANSSRHAFGNFICCYVKKLIINNDAKFKFHLPEVFAWLFVLRIEHLAVRIVRNNQTFIEVSTGRSHRIVTWVDDTDFEYFYNALQQYMDYTLL